MVTIEMNGQSIKLEPGSQITLPDGTVVKAEMMNVIASWKFESNAEPYVPSDEELDEVVRELQYEFPFAKVYWEEPSRLITIEYHNKQYGTPLQRFFVVMDVNKEFKSFAIST